MDVWLEDPCVTGPDFPQLQYCLENLIRFMNAAAMLYASLLLLPDRNDDCSSPEGWSWRNYVFVARMETRERLRELLHLND